MGMPAPGTDPKETRRREQALGYGSGNGNPDLLDIVARLGLCLVVIGIGVVVLLKIAH